MFLLGLTFVACDKNDNDIDLQNITPAESVIIATAKPALSEDEVLDIVNSILDGSYTTSKLGKANAAGKGADFIAVYLFVEGTNKFIILADESNDDLCFGDITPTTLYFDNSAGDESAITVEDSEGTPRLTITGNFTGLFSSGLNSITKTASDGVKTKANFDAVNGVTFN